MANEARVSAAALVVVYESAVLGKPDTPTLTIPASGLLADGGLWYGSAYGNSGTSIMADSEIQVDDTDNTFGSLVVSGSLGGPILSGQITGLAVTTTYWARLRYKDAGGIWSDWSNIVQFTTTALVAPNQPVLSVLSFGETWAFLATTAYSHPLGLVTNPHGATNWQVATDSGFVTIVHDAPLSSDLTLSHAVFGLAQNTPHYARAAWVDAFGQAGAWSATVTFTTATAPGARPATPTVTPGTPTTTSVSLTGSAFSGGTGTHATSTWEVSTSSTFVAGSTVFLSANDATNLTSITATGLNPGVLYYVRLLYTDDDTPLGADSLWSATANFTTATDIEVPRWTAPVVGQAVLGTAVSLTWSITSPEGDATYQIDYSIDDGVSWSSIAAAATGTSDTWDVSALADATYILRIRQESVSAADESIWAYTTVYVDNGLDVALTFTDESAVTPGDWTQLLDDYKALWDSSFYANPFGRWLCISDPATGFTWPRWTHGPSANSYDPALQPTAFDLVAECEIVGQRGGFSWATGYDVELCGAGVGGRLSGVSGSYGGAWPKTSQHGVYAYIYIFPASTFRADPLGRGPAFLVVDVLDGSSSGYHNSVTALGFDIDSSHYTDTDAKAPYNVRLLVTQIRDNGDGTEDIRVRVGLYGPNVDPDAGFIYDQAINRVPLQCGGVGYVAEGGSGNHYQNVGSKQFRSMGCRGIEYGTCTAPGGFTPPVLGAGCAPPIFDLTFYDDTDTNALIGTATDLNITDPSFSTDPTHARPYLMFAEYGRPRLEVDPLRGKSNLAEISFAVLDKRGTACDWTTGAITGEIGDAAGESNFNGRRFVLRERLGDGATYEIVADGVVYQSRLNNNLVRFEYQGRSIRERERETEIFTTPNRRDPVTGVVEPTSYVYPIGPAKNYGNLTVGPGNVVALVASTLPAVGTFREWLVGGVPSNYGFIQTSDIAADVLTEDHIAIGVAEEQFDVNGVSLGQIWPYVGIQWRIVGTSTWTDWYDMPVPDSSINPNFGFLNGTNLFLGDSIPALSFGNVLVQLSAPGVPQQVPPDGSQIEFYVYARAAPSPTFPLYWDEGTYGDLLKEILDGAFGDIDPLLRYDAAQVAAMQVNTPAARIKIDEPVEDMRDWLEKNIFQPTGWVPSLNANKELCPLDTALPSAGVALSTLDETNTRHGDWMQDGGDAIHLVEFSYLREHTEVILAGAGYDQTADVVQILGKGYRKTRRRFWFDKKVTHLVQLLLIERPVTIATVSSYAATSGLKPFTIEPDSVRTFGGPGGQAVLQEAQSGAILAHARIRDILQRYPTGPEFVTVSARNTATVRSLKVGNFVIIDLDWVPNLSTNDRGGQLVALIVSAERQNNLLTHFTLLIAGGSGTGLTQPTLGTPTVGSTNKVTIPVTTVPASTTTLVQIAIATTEPIATSGKWQNAGTQTASGTTITTAPILPDATVWVRSRSEQTGFRPTDWTTAVSVAVTGPVIYSLRVVPSQSGDATVFFTVNATTLGLYVEYEVHQPNQSPGYSNVVEWDASAGIGSGFSSGFSSGFGGPNGSEHQRTLGIAMLLDQKISVRMTPYDGWTGSAVSGNAGPKLTASAIMETAPAGSGFSSGFSLGFGS